MASFVHSTFDGLLNPCFVFGVVKCKSFGNIERSILIVQIKHTLGRYIKQGLNRDQGWYWYTSTFEPEVARGNVKSCCRRRITVASF